MSVREKRSISARRASGSMSIITFFNRPPCRATAGLAPFRSKTITRPSLKRALHGIQFAGSSTAAFSAHSGHIVGLPARLAHAEGGGGMPGISYGVSGGRDGVAASAASSSRRNAWSISAHPFSNANMAMAISAWSCPIWIGGSSIIYGAAETPRRC